MEIIVIDDGSDDGTAENIKDFPDIRFFQQENKGVSSARNKGILNSNGDWLAFLDSDDEWLPNKLHKQIDLLNKNPSIKVCHSEEIWIRNGKRVNQMKKHKKHGGMIFEKCLPLCAMSPSSILIHRSIFDEVGLFDEGLPACEDYDLWLRITCKHPVLFHEAPLIKKYGGHKDQLSQKYWGMDRFRIKALEKALNSDELGPEHYKLALNMLKTKIKIYIEGALKRQKHDEAEEYRKKLDAFR